MKNRTAVPDYMCLVNPTACAFTILFFILLIPGARGQEPPDWAKRDYAATADQVFGAALRSIRYQHHEVKAKDDANHTVEFHVGMTAWSWGYNMKLSVVATDEAHSGVVIGLTRSGGKVVSWGSGKKEVKKILDGIDAELVGRKTGFD